MKQKWLRTSLLMIFISLALPNYAQQYLFVTEDIPPLQMQPSTGKATGALVELIELILEDANIDAKIAFYPWARSYQLAKQKPNVFIFSILRSPEREQEFIWLDKLFTLRSYLAALKSRHDIKVENIEQAKQYSVGAIRYDLAESYLLEKGFVPNKNLYTSNKYPGLWTMLYNGRTDLVFTNSVIWQYEISRTGLDATKLNLVYEIPKFATDLYLAANIKTDVEVINKIKKSFSQIKADGRYGKLLAKWQLR